MKSFKFELDRRARDRITGLEGVITARAEYLGGENCYQIEGKVTDTSRGAPTEWVYESRVELAD